MKLNFITREQGDEYAAWPKYRIETGHGITVAEIFGENNIQLGKQMAAAPDLLNALQDLVAERECCCEETSDSRYSCKHCAAVRLLEELKNNK